VTELDDRLFRCISSIFPNVRIGNVDELDVAGLMDMDSLAAVTLVSVLEEEFGVTVDAETLAKLGTFQAIRQYVCENVSIDQDEQRTR
jgi:acyl carrier protein